MAVISTASVVLLVESSGSIRQRRSTAAAPKKKKKILCFGGGFIGSAVIARLIQTNEYDITLASRGSSWPFDTETTIAPYVKHVYCDREDFDEDCDELRDEIESSLGEGEQYHAVLDFSGFEPQWVRDAIDLLKGKVRVYVYVSTDSVYEVCQQKNGDMSLETDAVRPEDEEERDRLNEENSYADNKLECENVLIEQQKQGDDGGVPYVSLRLSDVIGPRDSNSRFTSYILWIKYQHEGGGIIPPLHVPADILETSSVVHVDDAAQAVILAMNSQPDVWNEAYNIASDEIFNTTKAIEMVVGIVSGGQQSATIIQRWEEDALAFLPGVTRGPIDVSKAMKRLKFVPKSVPVSVEQTCEWYLEQFSSDEETREHMVEGFAEDLFGEDDEDQREDVIDMILSHFTDEF